MKPAAQAVAIIAMSLIPALGSALFHPKRPHWDSAAADEVTLSVATSWNVVWVDARPRARYEEAHIPGAVLLNEDEWEEEMPRFLEVWNPDAKVVVYCSSSGCETSHEVAARIRRELGIEVFVLQGGWESWLARK